MNYSGTRSTMSHVTFIKNPFLCIQDKSVALVHQDAVPIQWEVVSV